MKKIAYFFAVVVLFSVNASADSPDWEVIGKSIQEKMKASHVSGLQMSYQTSDGVQRDFNFGSTDLSEKTPVTDDTRFYSASLTKMFTAISLFQLREKGLVSFDDKIVDHFVLLHKNASVQMEEITIRQLMSHTSGMSRNGEQFWTDPELISKGIAPTEEEVINAAIKQRFGVSPGVQLKYSNLGFEILGLLVGKLCDDCKGHTSQQRYADYVKRHILIPLKMGKSGFNPSSKLQQKFAVPYKLADAQGNREAFSLVKTPGASVGAWGLYSTSKDMIKFIKELGKLVSKEKSLLVSTDISAEIETAVLEDALNSSFGHSLGFRLIKIVDGNKNVGYLIGHTGTFPGFSSAAFYNTLDKSSGVVYFNVVDGGGVGYLMLVATPMSGITQLPGAAHLKLQEAQDPLMENPYLGIVKKWDLIYGATEVVYENNQYFLVQSGQKIPLYLKLSEDKKSLDGYLGTNSGYLDWIGDSIHFSIDEAGNSDVGLVANSILIRARK